MVISLFPALVGISVIIFLGFLSELLFNKTHVPDVLILFLFGVLVGPVLNWVSPTDIAPMESLFISLTLILIVFEGAFNIKLHDFMKEIFSGTALALLFFVSSVMMITTIMVFFDYHLLVSLLLGTILGGTSSIVVIPLLKLVHINSKASLVLTLEAAFTDVLCIVSTLTVIELISFREIGLASFLYSFFLKFVVAVVLGTGAGVMWFFIKNKFHGFDRAYMTTVAYAILLYVLVEALNSNGVIAVLSLGIVLGNTKKMFQKFLKKEIEYKVIPAERLFYSELSFFTKVFFFVYLGLIIDFSRPILFVYGAVISIFVLLVRPYLVRLISRNAKEITDPDKVIMTIMAPKGIVAVILAQVAFNSSALRTMPGVQDIPIIAFSVILFSIIITSIFVFVVEKAYKPEKDNKNLNHAKV